MNNISDDTTQKAFKICQEYMGRSWRNLNYNDFKISHISGGLSNLLYLCEIQNNRVQTEDGEPRKVLLRIYGSIIKANPEMVVTDSVIFGLLAEKGMGPKLYGVFTEGRVEEYVESRHLWTRELHMPSVSSECARIMARFHKMTMPLVKKPVWLFDIMDRYLKEAEDVLHEVAGGDKTFTPDLLKTLDSFNIAKELQTLKKLLKQVNSPVTFCHNDMQEGNILLNDGRDIGEESGHLMPIDYEYSSFNFRGFDIGNHFCEWCYNYHEVTEFPFYAAKLEDYPNREQQLGFMRSYIAEMGFDSSDSVNSEEHLMKEANTYALASHYMWALWSVVQARMSTIEFGYLEYALARFEGYFEQKKQVIAQYSLTCE